MHQAAVEDQSGARRHSHRYGARGLGTSVFEPEEEDPGEEATAGRGEACARALGAPDLAAAAAAGRLARIPDADLRPAAPELVARVHTAGMVPALERVASAAGPEGRVVEGTPHRPVTYVTPTTLGDSLRAAGAAAALVDAVAAATGAGGGEMLECLFARKFPP